MIPKLSSRGHSWSSFSVCWIISHYIDGITSSHTRLIEMFWLQEVCDQLTIALPLVPAAPLGARRLLVHIHCCPHLLQPGWKRVGGTGGAGQPGVAIGLWAGSHQG